MTTAPTLAMPATQQVHPDDARLLEILTDAFAHLAGDDQRIDAFEFQRVLGVKSGYVAQRVFSLFDSDKNGWIEKKELLDRVRGLVFGTNRQKLRFVFRLHDHNEDGVISYQELDRMISLSLAEDGVAVGPDQVRQLVQALFSRADSNRDGNITFEELEAVVRQHPGMMEQLVRSEARWIAPNEELAARLDGLSGERTPGLASVLTDHRAEVVFLSLYFLSNLALFVHAVLKYRDLYANEFVQVARGCGACLNFNGALILIPMMRRFSSWVRSTWAARVLPLDESVGFHRVVGHAMFGFGVLHTVAHLSNYAFGTGKPFFDQLLFTKAGLTGLVLLVVFGVMWFFARTSVRRSGHFELFYATHMLYFAWFALALLHGPVFWIWAGVPILGFAAELSLRLISRGRRTDVIAGQALRSGVTRLELMRPPGFAHEAGDYLFLRIPAVARHEWHPFTISSAPERQNITVHIRNLGNWTSAIRKLAEDISRAGSRAPLTGYIDGPYGTPSGHIFESKRAIMIGAGIGVTPFAAILESLLMRAYGYPGSRSIALEKLHFVWLNRDQYSFEWFGELLARLESQDTRHLLDIHIYMTAGRTDIAAGALSLARDVLHAERGTDLITGLRAKTKMGAPDWEALLGGIRNQHWPERVDVFYCGPEGLGDKIGQACRKLGLPLRKERF